MALIVTELCRPLCHDEAEASLWWQGPYSQGCGVPSGQDGCENRALKKAECQIIDAFKLWCWRRPARVPWTARRSNQSILTEMNPEYLNIHWKDWCWAWSSSILVTCCEQLAHYKTPWCWERLKAEGQENVRGWGGWMASLMQWTWSWANFRRWWGTRKPGVLQSMGLQRVGHDWATEQPQHRELLGGKVNPPIYICIWRWRKRSTVFGPKYSLGPHRL